MNRRNKTYALKNSLFDLTCLKPVNTSIIVCSSIRQYCLSKKFLPGIYRRYFGGINQHLQNANLINPSFINSVAMPGAKEWNNQPPTL